MFKTVGEFLRRKVAKNSLINLTARISVLIISVLFIAYISRQLNKTQLGILALLFVFYSLIGIIGGLGLATSAIRLIPELKAKGEYGKVSDIIKITMFVSVFISLVVVIFGICMDKNLALIFLKAEKFSVFITWLLIISFFYSICDKINLIHQSLQQFGKLAFLNVLTNISQRVIAIIFFVLGYGLRGIFLGFFLGSVIGVILGVLTLRKYIFCKYYGYPLKEYIRFSFPYCGQDLSRFMFSQADQALVAVLFTPEILAIYFVAKKIISLVTLVFIALLEPVIPKLAEMKSMGILLFKENMNRICRIFSFLVFVGVTLIFINSKNFMFWIGGEKFANNYFLLNILAISVFLYALFSLSNIGVYLFEKPEEMFKLFLYVGVTNVTFGVVFGLLFGLKGFAWAQSIGFLLGVSLIRYQYGEKWMNYIRQRDIAYVFLICGGFIFGYYLNKYFFPVGDNIPRLIKPFILNLIFSIVVVSYLRGKRLAI